MTALQKIFGSSLIAATLETSFQLVKDVERFDGCHAAKQHLS
jgi:hypothetical protein